MPQIVYRVVWILLAASFIALPPAYSQQISKQNPYRNFNFHGVNYGALRWEQEHRNKAQSPPRTVRRRFR